MKKLNHLAGQSSPYLLQHAGNPVEWYPWGEEAFHKATSGKKIILLSIGYSACHWCHVMERESFESEEIASIMNEHFVSVKVDREERPDIDQVYMEAVQVMGINGGWPLNVFLTPDRKPFYGGTYFPPSSWKKLLLNLAAAYRENPGEIEEHAAKLVSHISIKDSIKFNLETDSDEFMLSSLYEPVDRLSQRFDQKSGGLKKAPKFPMPTIWEFLLSYGTITSNKEILDFTSFTLEKIAWGGIYDQAGGGFARYSVDQHWLVPHFEKMLYDNAQLVSLYAHAYLLDSNPLFKEVVYDTITFLKRELMNPSGGYYSALDADSEGEEGKYYVWEEKEIDHLLGEKSVLVKDLWGIRPEGNWEPNKNILHVTGPIEKISEKNAVSPDMLRNYIREAKHQLLLERGKRARPGLDDKIITSWNGLMLQGLVDAYAVFEEKEFLDLALLHAQFLESLITGEGELWRITKNGASHTPGFLEDYSFVIQGFISLYQVTSHEHWLKMGGLLTEYALRNFFDPSEDLFYFTGRQNDELIARKKEIFDNVIPSSNSVMAKNLFLLGKIMDRSDFYSLAIKMVSRVASLIKTEPEYASNWAGLYLFLSGSFAEIVVLGPEHKKIVGQLLKYPFPNRVILSSAEENNLPLFRGRKIMNNKTTLYVCFNKTCKVPVYTAEDAIRLLQQT